MITELFNNLDYENARESTIDEMCDLINAINEEKGWNTERSFDEWAALFHTEISEAYEEYRNHHPETEVYYNGGGTKPEGIPIELADCVIRIMHFFAQHNLSLHQAILTKIRYNMTRPYRHGNKKS